MPYIYDNTDLAWTSKGDLSLSHDGDIMDTYEDPLRSLYQEIRTRVMSEQGDWSIYPGLGANLSDFVGEPNNKQTAESIKVRIISSLTRSGLVQNADVNVRCVPIEIDKIMVRISITVLPTARNAGSDTLLFNLLYDYSENHAYFVQ